MTWLASCVLVVAVAASLPAQDSEAHPSRDLRGRVQGLTEPPARVTLWRNDMRRATVELLGDVRTTAEGTFAFDDVDWVQGFDWGFNSFVVVARAGELVGLRELRGDEVEVDQLTVDLRESIDLKGVLRSAAGGKPIADAAVWPAIFGEVEGSRTPQLWLTAPLPFWRVRTDAAGHFTLRGLPNIAPIRLRVDHDDYASGWVRADDPAALCVGELDRGGKISGTVSMPDGKPAVRVVVKTAAIGVGHGRTITDEHGRFRLTGLAADAYKVWAEAPDLTVIAVADLQVRAGDHIRDQHVQLVRGGFIVGRIVDAANGEPIRPGPHTDVAMYGPARPRGGACECAPVLPDGTFRIRAPEGSNYIYMRGAVGWSSASETVLVRDGEDTEVVWRLTRAGKGKE